MDLHGTMENYFEAKLRLFEVSREAVVNAKDSASLWKALVKATRHTVK